MSGRTKVDYEWVVEPTDKHGDIIDPAHFEEDQFSAALEMAKSEPASLYPDAVKLDLALKRVEWEDIDGETDRQYVYFDDKGELPETFDAGARVPKRFLTIQVAA